MCNPGTTIFSAKEADLALSARAELRLGDASWKQYDDFSSWRGNSAGLMLGGAVHWESVGRTAAFGAQAQMLF